MKKYILIACEESQTECMAFRKAGAEAYSCDLQACSGGHNEWHIRGDVLPFLKGQRYFKTEDGKEHHVPQWDMIIAHPPCTYLCKSGSVNLYKNSTVDPVREAYGICAADFFKKCLVAKAKHVAVENPVPMSRWNLPICTQIIQPYQFGAPWSKRTCLWLVNLPPLLPTAYHVNPKEWVRHTGKAKVRSKSFPEIADAMVTQWLPLL